MMGYRKPTTARGRSAWALFIGAFAVVLGTALGAMIVLASTPQA